MATLKHLASKSSDYGRVLEYLLYEHDDNGNPVRNDKGEKMMRERFILDGINCSPFSFDKECERLNWKYHKNQKFSDIKSHHYILSFDPLDKEEGLLTPERAQELGMEYARKCFPGHQAIVCTHGDGHNGSGNIHCHIIINSLRKLDVARQPFMEREIDSRAGYKHNLTRSYLEFLQSEVMRMCEREGLHQVDLLSPAKVKITDLEYKKRVTGQKNLDERNAEIIAANLVPRKTVFQTQKQYLRDAIQDAMASASTLEEFIKILKEKYHIVVKDHRGRFSYLHPDRKKYITGRALGTDFEKESILEKIQSAERGETVRTRNDGLKDHLQKDTHVSPSKTGEMDNSDAGENGSDHKSVDSVACTIGEKLEAAFLSGKTDVQMAYDPSYDYSADPIAILFVRTKLRLVVDLQTNIKAQMSTAYAQKVKLTNLKEMAKTVVFLQEHGIGSVEELAQKQNEVTEMCEKAEADFKESGDMLRKTNEQIHFAGQYYATRVVHADFMKAWNKGRFRAQHREDLNRYDEAVRFFEENYSGNIPSMKDLREQKDVLLQKREKQETDIKAMQQTRKNLQNVVANVDAILNFDVTRDKAVARKNVIRGPEI